MNRDVLLKHFDRISEAPHAVARLRKFILELAVRGKLVEQDPDDESAHRLLTRIAAVKARLISAKKIRAQNTEPMNAEDAPHSVPDQWVWTRLGAIGDWGSGSTPSRQDYDSYGGHVTWLKSGELNDNRNLIGSEEKLTEKAVEAGSFRRNAPGDVLVAMYGATIGKAAILGESAVTNQAVCGCTPFEGVSNQYLFLFLLSQRDQFHAASEGGAQPNISKVKLVRFPFPLPPYREQSRIVAKVDELMVLCDELEVAQRNREECRHRFTAASINIASDEVVAQGASQDANFFVNHLRKLTARLEQIEQIRIVIHRLAVRGRLVEQNPEDEPATELRERVHREKQALIRIGKIKRDKELWDGLPAQPPHELPEGWLWTRLQDLFEISRGGSPRPAGDPRYFGGPIPWVTVREITKNRAKFLTTTEEGLTEEGASKSRFINPGDLLLTNSGATLGVPKISQIRACMNDGVAVLRSFHSEPLNDFAYLFLHSQTEAFRRINQGMGQPNLNTPMIAGWYFPLPPLAEQQRIVAKVNELMTICDELEQQLKEGSVCSQRLLEAVLHEALNGEVGDPPFSALQRGQAVAHGY